MAQLVKNIASPHQHSLGHDTVSFLFSVSVVVLSAVCGYGLALLFLPANGVLSISPAAPYAGCVLPAEYILRASELCWPVLIETAIVWISAYVDFEKPLLAVIFSLHGLSVGGSLCAVLLAAERSRIVFLPLAYAAITAVLLVFTRFLRRDVGRVPLSQSAVYALLAGGVACTVALAATFLLS